MTLQLDEYGEATLTPEDVLVSSKGTLWAMSDLQFLEFQYDHVSQSLVFIDDIDASCDTSFNVSNDRNPINKREYLSGVLIDCCESFSPYTNPTGCDLSQAKLSVGENVCNYYWGPPLLFSFDVDGILYAADENPSNGIYTFDPYSNISSPFLSFDLDVFESGITYDFDNHRLIATKRSPSNDVNFVAIDLETGVWEVLFEIPAVNNCRADAIEYIGNNIVIMGSGYSTCKQIFSIDLVTQDITLLTAGTGYLVSDFLFIEDEIPDATLSTSQFNCNDLGQQTVDITVLENGTPVNYQATVYVVSDFSVRNCSVFRRLFVPDPNGSDDAVVEDYTNTIDIVSSCSSTFTITQDPPPGTLIPYGDSVTILITVTDEFGNTAFCQTIGCSDSILATEDQTLQNSFIVSPNPTSDLITIENTNGIPINDVEILDFNGRLLKAKEISSKANSISLSLASFSNGIYFIKINSEDDFIVKQILKK
ncbi:MAG: T9SS C-terminal target domain-containing protein [Flavobacterium sp.]|nr:MAG: T9SS C-terminal target domain-containing protein [Flavobacterium sp.]